MASAPDCLATSRIFQYLNNFDVQVRDQSEKLHRPKSRVKNHGRLRSKLQPKRSRVLRVRITRQAIAPRFAIRTFKHAYTLPLHEQPVEFWLGDRHYMGY